MGPAIVLKTVARGTSTLKNTKRGGRQSVVTLWTQRSIHTDQRETYQISAGTWD